MLVSGQAFQRIWYRRRGRPQTLTEIGHAPIRELRSKLNCNRRSEEPFSVPPLRKKSPALRARASVERFVVLLLWFLSGLNDLFNGE